MENEQSFMNVLLIGYGNPLRGDDGAGWYVAEHLAHTLHDTRVQVICCHQLTPELAEDMSRARLVIFIDAAMVDPAKPDQNAGYIRCQTVTHDSQSSTRSSHHLTPSILLEYTRLLYATVPVALLLTVTGKSFEYQNQLSSAVCASLPELYRRVEMLLKPHITRDISS